MTEMSIASPRSFDKVARFLIHYGDFLAFWSTFDVMVEIVIMRELGTTKEKTSIVCAGLTFGPKVAIACSLLNSRSKGSPDRTAVLLREAQQLSERNSFAHGFFLVNKSTETFELIRREVRDTYTARLREFDFDAMSKHTARFIEKVNAFQTQYSISEDDFLDYVRDIEARALVHASPDKRRPAPPTNFVKAKKKSRRGRAQ